MAGDIYDLVNKATQSQSDTKASKVQLGYTVDTYKGVLAELQKYQSALAQAASGGAEMGAGGVTSTQRPIFARWTLLGSINVLDVNSVDADQFIVDSDGDRTKFRQRKCVLKPFMSFAVNITDTEGKELGYFAGFDSHNETLNGGISASSTGKLTYPLTNMTDKTCDTVGSALGNMENPFEIGIGVDFEKNADVFFSACFPSIYKAGMSGKLVAKKALLAEVSFVNGTKAQTLHARVIANASSPDGLLQSVYFPVPLLLLSDYKSLGKVGVNDGEVKIVGQDCTFSFANSKFDHLEAKINDFTPQYLKDILSKHRTVSQATAIFDTTKWQDQKSVEYDLCYVRFYLDKTKLEAIKEVLGQIPDDAELYKGVDEAKQGEKVIGWEEAVGDYTGTDVYFPPELAAIISKEHYMKALSIIRTTEVGTPTMKGAGNAEWNVAGDGAGITYGNYQTTGKSGGLAKLINLYISDPNSNPTLVQEVSAYKEHAGTYGSKTNGVEKLMQALIRAGREDPNMNIMQSKHLYINQIQDKGLINAYKNAGLTSALGFTIALHCYNQGRPSNFWTGVAQASDEATKCNLMLSHEDAFLRKFKWWKQGGNHDRYITDYRKAVMTGNFNLAQRQRWCNASF